MGSGFAVAAYIKAYEDPAPLPPPDPTPVQPAAGLLTKVYVTGGFDITSDHPIGELLKTAESYDPSTEKWTTLASMSTVREDHALGYMTESDGKHYLYAVGGLNSTTLVEVAYNVERYDILTDSWSPVSSSMSTRRHGLAVGVLTLDQKQQLYAVGGSNNGTTLNTVEKYDPSIKGDPSWKKVADMNTARRHLAVGVLTEAFGKQYLYAVGGFLFGYFWNGDQLEFVGGRKTVEKYDPVNNTWKYVQPMSKKRNDFGVGVLTDSRDGKQYMYAVGGENLSNSLKSVERYDYESDSWTPVASMLQNRSHHTVAVVTEADGKQYMYAAGGKKATFEQNNALKTVERYDPLKNEWTYVDDMSTVRTGHARVGDNV